MSELEKLFKEENDKQDSSHLETVRRHKEIMELIEKARDKKGNRGMTNFEWIKSMTIEEMAVSIPCPNEMGMAEIYCDHDDDKNCCECCLEWLKTEAE